MSLKNVKILLTIIHGGRLQGMPCKKLNKAELSKINCSPVETISKSGKVITPNNNYKSPDNFIALPVGECVQKTIINEEAVNHMISTSYPNNFSNFKGKATWMNMSERQRLEYHLSSIAGGKPYRYEIVD